MKINDVNRINAYQSYKNQVNRASNPEPVKKVQLDKIEFSSTAQEKLQVEKEKRIQDLKNQIENGTYKIDSEKIAEKLMADWKKGTEQ
ncbi:flagellar biosynthesis anti-sigma factor FlgM [Neobacillus sp. LXY-4]|uniref:flagellar biosynthesis anti-sigma factor FlgM n=1 Tax=Neobacillus sp. LXY-4 TaxID=3379826 RepID=UPI003EDF6784